MWIVASRTATARMACAEQIGQAETTNNTEAEKEESNQGKQRETIQESYAKERGSRLYCGIIVCIGQGYDILDRIARTLLL